MAEFDLTRDELSWSIDTLGYELRMMRGLREYMDTHSPPDDDVLRNAILESFLLHVRNLYEFFYGGTLPKKKKNNIRLDDIRAVHHFTDAAAWKPAQSLYLEGEIERINKRLVHMTNQRDNPNVLLMDLMLHINWEPSKLCDELEAVASQFFTELGDPHELSHAP